VSSRGFNLDLSKPVLFTLIVEVPIHSYYLTDRRQRLQIIICVLLKKKSHLHLGCPGGKQINIKFSFLGELSL